MQGLRFQKSIAAVAVFAAMAACSKSDSRLIESAQLGDTDTVRLLLREDKVSGESKVNALGRAAAWGRTETVRAFLEAGVDANARREREPSALMLATVSGHVDTMQLLIDSGADPRQMDKEGASILCFAMLGVPLEIKREIEASQRDQQSAATLDEEVAQRHLRVVQVLVKAGADVNARDTQGFTPLMVGMLDDPRVLKYLILEGADVNATGEDGMTALMIAATAGKASAVQLLIDAKADVNARYRTGETALTTARSKKHENIVQLLVAAGAID